jgi:predicted membrane-bound dolichyl-phosphate-mannose-protein mannosyltransferase
MQGPCFYPAGHLWLYYPFYVLYTSTENAEHYMKVVHYLMHSAQNLLVSLIGFEYFENDASVSQLICFVLLANSSVRREESAMYNDQFMAFFQVLAIYLLVKRKVFWASMSFSAALSIKAGAVLMLPVFLGTV